MVDILKATTIVDYDYTNRGKFEQRNYYTSVAAKHGEFLCRRTHINTEH